VGGDPVVGPREDVGLIFQSPNLLPWRSVERNVSLPLEVGKRATKEAKRAARARADEFLSMVGLLEFKDKLPHELSGGMQQRAGIVRALVQDPTILLMDEPFGAVDVLTREKLNFEIQSLWEQTRKTIVFVTHSIQEAVFLADVIFVFSPRPGTIIQTVKIELGRPRERATIHTPVFFEYEELVRAHVKEAA
jgi:NitT/TauT family transport system ATP-binding protein